MYIQSLLEAKQVGSAMLVTGALNPYTSAHETVAEMSMRHAIDNGHSHFYHGIGASEMKPDAPLTHEQKTKIVSDSHRHLVKKLGSKLKTEVIPRVSSVSPFHQIAYLIDKGHKKITIAVGSDQLQPGGLRSSIESHMKQHGGFLGTDKKPHQVDIKLTSSGHHLGNQREPKENQRNADSSLCAHRNVTDMAIQLAEAHLRNKESAWQTGSQPGQLASVMAREVATGQVVV
jgi:hypothetical protein